MKLQTYDSRYFLGKILFGDDCSQNISVYQPPFSMLGLKEEKGNESVISWKFKYLFESNFSHYMVLSCQT